MKLPKGFAIEAPKDADLQDAFAAYSAHYAVKDDVLTAERTMRIKQAKVTESQWAAYQAFSKGLREEQAKVFSLVESGSERVRTGAEKSSAAAELVEQAVAAWQARNLDRVRELLGQAEQLNPTQSKLWGIYGTLEMQAGNVDKAIADCRKEIYFHPEEVQAYQQLSLVLHLAGHRSEAIEAARKALTMKPDDEAIATQLTRLLVAEKRYGEIPEVLEKAIAAAPQTYRLQAMRADALLRNGQQEAGIAEAKKIAQTTTDPSVLNDLAYSLSETDCALALAQELALKAVAQTEQDCSKASLNKLEAKSLEAAKLLAAVWDTLGWAYLKQNELGNAERYIDAAWRLSERAEVADHLGQIFAKQGKHSDAIRMWRLALAANPKDEDAHKQLRKAGAPLSEAARQFGSERTIPVAELPKQHGSAEYFVVFSQQGVEDVQFISGANALQDATAAIRAVKYRFPFPDSGPEKIIRRGILYCSEHTTPSCKFTMLLPSTTTVAALPAKSSGSDANRAAVR